LLIPLHGRRARKGVFGTTSTGTREALGYTAQIDTKIVLVDGRTLARLMIPTTSAARRRSRSSSRNSRATTSSRSAGMESDTARPAEYHPPHAVYTAVHA
jgi:hypothetical protein